MERTANDTETINPRRFFRKEGLRALSGRGTQLKLIFAVIIVTLLSTAMLYAVENIYYIFDFQDMTGIDAARYEMIENSMYDLEVLLFALLVVPLLCGLFALALGLYENNGADDEMVGISRMFVFFDSFGTWVRCIRILFEYLWRLALSCVVPAAAYYAAYMIYDGGIYDEPYMVFVIMLLGGVGTASLCVGILLSCRVYPLLSLCLRDRSMTVSAALRLSRAAMRDKCKDALLLIVGFAGWFLLSFLTVGVLALIFVVPYFLLTNAAYSSYICDTINLPKGTAVETAVTKQNEA